MDAGPLVMGAVAGLVVGVVVARMVARSMAASAFAGIGRQAQVDRDAVVKAAVDTVVAVAGERLGAQAEAGSRELQARHDTFEARLGELRGSLTGELAKVADLVVGLQRERAEQQGRVEARLAEVASVGAKLADTTQSLRQALANPNARGQWGERMAEDVLRAAGMVEGINYRKQATTSSGTVPDFTFLLPGGRVLHMDVKFPIDNYLRHLDADTDAERDRHRVAFVRDVRARVRELRGRAYVDPDETLDEVLLFIPNEAVYAFVHTHDRDLVEVALGQKVVLCSPCTLFSVLAVIRQAVEQSQLERRSDDILRCLASFEGQWAKFTEALERVGRNLDTVRRGWEDLSGPRRRQLERELDRVADLRSRREAEALDTGKADGAVDAGDAGALGPLDAGGDDGSVDAVAPAPGAARGWGSGPLDARVATSGQGPAARGGSARELISGGESV